MRRRDFTTLTGMLEETVAAYPKRTALVFGSKKVVYKELLDVSRKLAHGLWEKGVRESDRVSLWLPNCPEYVYSFFAVSMLRAIVCPINTMFKREEAKFVLENCGAKILIVSVDRLDDAANFFSRIETLKYIIVVSSSKHTENILDFYIMVNKSAPLDRRVSPESDDPVEILYTSGTTGTPKGAVLTHRNVISNIKDCLNVLRVTKRDSFICILPLFHSFASTVCMLLPLSCGAKVVLMRTVKPFKRVIRAILKNRVTVFVAVPSLYNILSGIKISTFKLYLSYLINPVRICFSGAAALPYPVWEKFERKYKRPLLQGYGLTEAAPIVTLNLLKGKRRPESIGRPLPSVVVRVVDNEGNPLPLEKVGELCVKGDNVMRGYYNNVNETEKILKNGWLYTGDLARIDREGFVYIMGRAKDMINVRGFNVYPEEIENLLYRHPHIIEAAVVGVSHRHRGEVPVGFIVKEGEVIYKEVMEYLRVNLASYKVPLKIFFKDSLPKNSTGKVLKKELRAEVAGIFK